MATEAPALSFEDVQSLVRTDEPLTAALRAAESIDFTWLKA